jgi:predicted nucleotidyltransferase
MLLTKEPRFLKIYKAIEPHISDLQISRIRLFGSYAKGSENDNSDIDIIVDIQKPIGIYKFIAFKQNLETALKRKIDLFEPDSLEPLLRDSIISEAKTIYEQR